MPKPCMCNLHKGALVPYWQFKSHLAMILKGKLGLWAPVNPDPVEFDEKVDAAVEGADSDEGDKNEEGDQHEAPQVETLFASEVTELVARNQVTVTGAEAMLQSTHRIYQPLLTEAKIPKTWYHCKKMSTEGKEPLFFTRDYCPKCDFLFPVDAKMELCGRCEQNTRYDGDKPARVAYFFDLADKVTRVFASKYTADLMSYGTKRARPTGRVENRELVDWWDSSIAAELFHDLPDEDKKDYLYFACSNDGVEVEKKVSYTPVTAKLMNMAADARGMLGSIWLLGFWPPKVKDYQAMLLPVVEMFAKHAPGEEPIDVYDAHLKQRSNKWVVLAQNTNDIRGVTPATCGKAPPSLVGSCNMCMQEGVRHRTTTVLPGAVRALPEAKDTVNDALREAYAAVFEANDDLAAFAEEGRPPKRNKASAVASGNRVRRGEAKEKDEAYKDVDHHTTMLWYHDKIKHTLYDLAHQLANVLKQILKFSKDKQKQDRKVFTPDARAYEVETLGRFPELAEKKGKKQKGESKWPKPPWVSPPANQDDVNSLPGRVQYPTGWPALRAIFLDLGFMKTSETLLLAGDVGAYVLRHAGIAPEYRDLFIEVLRVIERYTHKRTQM